MSDHDKVPLNAFDPTGVYGSGDIRFEEGFSTDLFAESARRFLRAQRGEAPFCLYVAFTAPHDPRTPPREYEVSPDAVTIVGKCLAVPPLR